MKSTAVFVDRDGTIIEDRAYIADPDDVRLLPGAAEAIRRLARRGYRVILVSNQSGVARGLFDERTLAAVHDRVEELLRAEGASLHGAYYCPFLDGTEATVEAYRRDSDQRKPSPGMLLQAARDYDVDLSRSWMIGDSSCDVEAGRRAGCRTILLHAGSSGAFKDGGATFVAASLLEAASLLDREADPGLVAGGGHKTNEPGQTNRGHEAKPAEGSSARPDESGEVVDLLNRIHDRVEHLQRQSRQQDFSLRRLLGSLLQMLAIVSAAWGVVALLDDRGEIASARLLLACFLQLGAIAGFVVDRFR